VDRSRDSFCYEWVWTILSSLHSRDLRKARVNNRSLTQHACMLLKYLLAIGLCPLIFAGNWQDQSIHIRYDGSGGVPLPGTFKQGPQRFRENHMHVDQHSNSRSRRLIIPLASGSAITEPPFDNAPPFDNLYCVPNSAPMVLNLSRK